MSNKTPLDRSQLPEPVYEAEAEYIKLYWKAWEYAWDHVYERPDTPAKRYMDEALDPDTIWIWDSCFMVLYCRYAPHYFPGIETLNNFYIALHQKKNLPIKIHHIDNPPLFAWVEYEYFKYTGDLKRLKWVMEENRFLQKHYEFIKTLKRFRRKKVGTIPTFAKKREFGYQWLGTPSGMDNTPRGRDKYLKILWIDLLAQQGLAAEHIIRIARILDKKEVITEYEKEYYQIKELLNQYYWNEQDGVYYDIKRKHPEEQVKVKTPATYWPMLAGMCSESQAQKLAENARDPHVFGGIAPWPSVSRDDPDFNPKGEYWRGGVWLPMAYLGTKALDRYGFLEIAAKNAQKLLDHMVKIYNEYEPHTIWEVYSPTKPKPATYKGDKEVFRPNFCGWSALGPISMFIEDIIGFYEVNAVERVIQWRLDTSQRHGIKRFRVGEIITDILYEDGKVSVDSNKPYTLIINSKDYQIKEGSQKIDLP